MEFPVSLIYQRVITIKMNIAIWMKSYILNNYNNWIMHLGYNLLDQS